MRYLNKIVFINSATVPYAEVPLDGNVHFIGTQGVGKSTVLRAILYFYNADSRKLGIPKGRIAKTFAEFYLTYSNSYIIYEVAKETGAFCVVAYKSQNRVCYRFIDTVYKADYFIKQSGDALDTWSAIREKLDANRVNVSSVVNSYDRYRDILYGNFTGRNEFNKYALLEAKQYKNIYRTIQNVFLNTKLDANEIKQTIISSIEEERIFIDLERYKHHLTDFEKNIENIRRFRFPSVQKQAESATQMLSAIRQLNREQCTLVGHLFYRLDIIDKEEPFIKKRQTQLTADLGEKNKQLAYESNLFDKRKMHLNGEISQLRGKLKEATDQKKYYSSKNISELIARVAANETLKLELESAKKIRVVLTNQFSDVDSKYDALIKEEENQFKEFRVQKDAEKNEIDREYTSFLMTLNKDYEQLIQALEKESETELHNEKQLLDQRITDVHTKEKKKIEIKHARYYVKEIQSIENSSKKAHLALSKAAHDKVSYKQQIDNLRAKWEHEKLGAERRSEQTREKLQTELCVFKKTQTNITDRIARSEKSLYGWLNANKVGWESSIGKVIDKEVLFQGGLSPQITENNSSIFGVKLDLENINSPLKSMDDYRFELKQLDEKINQHNKTLQKEEGLLLQELDKVKRRNSSKIKEIKELMRQAEHQFEHQGQEEKKLILELASYEEKVQKEKEEHLRAVQKEIDEAILQKQEAATNYEACNDKLRKKKENKQREKTRRVNEVVKKVQLQKEELQKQLEKKKQLVEDNYVRLKSERNKELDNKGADSKRLSEVEKRINSLDNELAFIEKNRDIVSEYNKDKRELFDKEKDFKNTIASLETKITQRQKEFAILKSKLITNIEHLTKQIQETVTLIEEYQSDLDKYKEFATLPACSVIEEDTANAEFIENTKTAVKTIEEITGKYYSIKERKDNLKTHIDKFLAHFSEGNIFKFPAKLFGDEYMSWAEELSDFIDDHKIDEYEKRTSETFAYIISSVGKDTTDLISKTGEIKKIINKINADFKQKNFVTAVDNIEMDITDSKNSAVLLLKKIKVFNDENALNIGVANLFSGDDQDKNNEKAVVLLKQLVKVMDTIKDSEIQLTDSFELSFRVVENGNDTGWADKLTNVGSEGTDVLVKAMVNIMLLNVFKEGASRKFKDFKLHCMMDEIGKLHPTNVKGILKFANERNILLINGSPTESTPLNYRHIYKISKDENKQSKIKRIISNPLV